MGKLVEKGHGQPRDGNDMIQPLSLRSVLGTILPGFSTLLESSLGDSEHLNS